MLQDCGQSSDIMVMRDQSQRALLEKADAWPATWFYLYVSFLPCRSPPGNPESEETRDPDPGSVTINSMWPHLPHLQ